MGEALASAEDRQVKSVQAEAKQARSQRGEERQTKEIERLSIELDGVLARMRRGSVPMEKQERLCLGDVSREIKAGAVFRAERGPKRSEVVPGVYVDTREPDSMRYVARRTAKGGFGWLLYPLALDGGLEQARAGWSSLATAPPGSGIWPALHFPGAVQIVDLYHAKEHVWEVAHAVFGCGTAAGTAWATQGCSLLEEGQIEVLISAIEARPSIAPEKGASTQLSRAGRGLLYHQRRAHALSCLPCGGECTWAAARLQPPAKPLSAPVPNASSMRWTPEGIDALLPVGTSVLNGAYDSLWRQEYAA